MSDNTMAKTINNYNREMEKQIGWKKLPNLKLSFDLNLKPQLSTKTLNQKLNKNQNWNNFDGGKGKRI